MILTIAIDGPAGSGKSTIARMLAQRLNITYLDTGAMYRAITLKLQQSGAVFEEGETLRSLLADTRLHLKESRVTLDGRDVTEAIRSQQVTADVSAVASLPTVREALVAMQQQIAKGHSIVMDGRDIGSRVLPDATVKFFLTASPEVRGRRRWLELRQKGQEHSLEEIIADVIRRDAVDSSRAHSPLICTPDAVRLDTSDMGIEAVIEAILSIIRERVGSEVGGTPA